ncbi:MAG: transcription-repair coupling factor, partial [Oscillochloris sp.]|nr:transcription-repair coupling factor [Oscillochloris sp.]
MVTLPTIVADLADLPECLRIAETLADRPTYLRVAPLSAAGRSPLLAALAMRLGRPLLYVTLNADAAMRAADDLRQWLGPEAVLLYPASDAMPYEHMSPGDEVIARRLRALQALDHSARRLEGLRTPVLVAPLKALLQPTLGPQELAEASTVLRRGQELSQDTLLRSLIGRGYRAAAAVEAPGELSRRGGIIDVWPSADERPLRIEFFGDEIDSLRRFDPATQRSDQRVDSATISPPHEIPLWNRAQALERIARVDLTSLRREARAEWQAAIARLEIGERFEGRAFYAPFFRNAEWSIENGALPSSAPLNPQFSRPHSTLLAHLPPGSAVLLSEEHLLAHHAAEIA